MDGEKIVFKCNSKDSSHVVDELTTNNTVRDLKVQVAVLMDIDLNRMKILSGFPPKVMDLSNDQQLIDELPLKSGDTLIVREESDSENGMPSIIPVAAIVPVTRPLHNQEQQKQQNSEPIVLAILPEGLLLQYIMPANNSCLFASTHFAQTKKTLPNYSFLRKIIAKAVAEDPDTYNEAFLGKPNLEYCKWILQEDHWGGAIELSILCKYYGFEIVAIDIQSLHLHHFGENHDYDNRIFLIYNGVHYDVMALRPSDPNLPLQTIFPVSNEVILQKAQEVALEAHLRKQQQDLLDDGRQYTCMDCNQPLLNHGIMREHARITSHVNYQES